MDIITDPLKLSYELIFDRATALERLDYIRSKDFWALDFETTSLSPDDGMVRLTSVSNGDETFLFDHRNCGSFEGLAKYFIGPSYAAFYANFEYMWFDAATDINVELWDVRLMKCAKIGGHSSSLASMVERDLNITMNKDMQISDWSIAYLSDEQMAYAAYDSYITWHLFDMWDRELTDEQLDGFHVMNSALRGNNEMESTGLVLNTGVHARNIKRWELKMAVAKRYFEKYTPPSIIKNINSNPQMSYFLKREMSLDALRDWPTTASGKDLQVSRDVLKTVAYNLPYPMNRWLVAFINYRKWAKYLSTYGEKLITIQNLSGKITTRFNVAAAKTGRYSSSSQNLQNIPKSAYIRKAFHAPPLSGEVMIIADYSSIEVRVLAELSGDKQLLHDAVYGNMHGSIAALAEKVPEKEFLAVLDDDTHRLHYVYKALRSKAKPGTFRITYGAGAGAVAMSIKSTLDGAQEFINAWAKRYPKAYGYRHVIFDHMINSKGFIPIVDGRTVYVPRSDRTLPVAANYPVQGAAASVMYRAVYHTHRLLVERRLNARLAATVHDELILYSSKRDSEAAAVALDKGMTLGWLDIFPRTDITGLLDLDVGPNWGHKS